MSIQVVETWLAQQCAAIPGVTSALIAMPVEKSGDRVVVHWPRQDKPVDALIAGLKNVLKHHRPLVQVITQPSKNVAGASLIGAPVQLDEDTFAAATLKLDGKDEAAAKAALKQLLQGLSELRHALAHAANHEHQQGAIKHLTDLLATTLDTEGFQQTALAACNELATRLRCERVSFAYRDGKMSKVVAVSNTTEIKSSRELVRAMQTMMDEAIDQQQMLTLNNGLGDEHLNTLAHRIYSRDHSSHNLVTVPLVSHEKIIGAFSFERAHHAIFKQQDCEVIEQIASFLAPVLALKYTLERPWTVRFVERIRTTLMDLGRGRHLLGKTFWLVVISLLVLSSLPLTTYRVDAPAQLEGAIQRSITAPTDGFIQRALAKPGDLVKKDQVLVLLEDKDLLLDQQRLRSRLAQLQGSFSSAMANRDLPAVAKGRSEIDEAKAELALIEQQLERTQITAPFEGEVIEGDLRQSLGSPVRRGEVMMTLAPVDDYRIVFHVSETEINNVTEGQHGALALASQPHEKHRLVVSRITPLANIDNGRNAFKVEAVFAESVNGSLRPGMEGVVKVDVEKRSLLWIVFHSAWDWLTMKRWQWLGF